MTEVKADRSTCTLESVNKNIRNCLTCSNQ